MVKNFIDKLKDGFTKKNATSISVEENSVSKKTGKFSFLKKKIKSNNPKQPIGQADTSHLPLGDASSSQIKSAWHSELKKKFQLQLTNISWRFSRRNDETTSNFKLPSTSSIQFEELSKLLFSPKNRATLHRLFLIALIISVPYTIGKMLALGIAPSSEEKIAKNRPPLMAMTEAVNHKEQMDRIRLVNLFNAISADSSAKKGPFVCEKSEKKTALPLKLVNTIVLQDSIKSIAAVQMRGSMDAITVREGDPIENIAQISKIERMRILLKNVESGECEYAENEDRVRDQMNNKRFNVLAPDAGKKFLTKMNEGIRNVGNHYFIKKNVREEAMKDMNNILTQARALQIRNADGSYSFKMTEIIPGSLYSKLNIQDGDIVTGINGKKIENINELMNMFGKIKDIDNMSITLTHEGQEQTLEYEFE